MQHLVEAIPEDGTVDLQPLFFKLTFDTTMFLLFGDSVSSEDWGQVAGQESEFAKAFNLSQEYLSHRGRLGTFYWLLNDRAFRDACKTCHHFIDKAIARALQASARDAMRATEGEVATDCGSYVFIEALVQQTTNPKFLRDQCLNVLLAGRDTTACCLHWTLYALLCDVSSHIRTNHKQPTACSPSARPREVAQRNRPDIGLGLQCIATYKGRPKTHAIFATCH